MSDKPEKLPGNVDGRFYTNQDCIDCDACRAVAPMFFKRNDENGTAYVWKQPMTEADVELCHEAMDACCTEAIIDNSLETENT